MRGRTADRIIIDDPWSVPVLPRSLDWQLHARPLSVWCKHMTTASIRALASSLRERSR